MALRDNMVSWWKLYEASGTRVDSHGSNDLTDNNTVGSAAGLLSENAADFERGNSEYLSITDAAQSGLDLTGDQSFACWVKFESIASLIHCIFGKYQDTNQLCYQYRLAGYANQESFVQWSSNGSSVTTKTMNMTNFSNWSTGTWYHVVWACDASAGQVKMYVDGVLEDTQTGLPTSVYNGTAPFTLGVGYFAGAEYMDGLIQNASCYSAELNSTEVSELYNSGTPLTYEGTAPAGGGQNSNFFAFM